MYIPTQEARKEVYLRVYIPGLHLRVYNGEHGVPRVYNGEHGVPRGMVGWGIPLGYGRVGYTSRIWERGNVAHTRAVLWENVGNVAHTRAILWENVREMWRILGPFFGRLREECGAY